MTTPPRMTSLLGYRSVSFMALAAALPLLSCSTAKELAACPEAAILADASSLVAFAPGVPQTPANETYRIAVTSITTDCDQDKSANRSTSSVEIHFHAFRHAGTEAVQYTLPYFVAVTQADQIISKQTHTLQFSFAPGQSGADASVSVGAIAVQAPKDKKPADYEILVGLQLTQEQLDRNRRIGRYMP